jgi:hypothetical protein
MNAQVIEARSFIGNSRFQPYLLPQHTIRLPISGVHA